MAHAIAASLNKLARDIDLPDQEQLDFIHEYFGSNDTDEYSSGMCMNAIINII